MARSKKPRPADFSKPRLCGGKYSYETRLDAEMVVEEKQVTDPDIELAVYHCPGNNHWHLTRVADTSK